MTGRDLYNEISHIKDSFINEVAMDENMSLQLKVKKSRRVSKAFKITALASSFILIICVMYISGIIYTHKKHDSSNYNRIVKVCINDTWYNVITSTKVKESDIGEYLTKADRFLYIKGCDHFLCDNKPVKKELISIYKYVNSEDNSILIMKDHLNKYYFIEISDFKLESN